MAGKPTWISDLRKEAVFFRGEAIGLGTSTIRSQACVLNLLSYSDCLSLSTRQPLIGRETGMKGKNGMDGLFSLSLS
jgi:hypothetical protein